MAVARLPSKCDSLSLDNCGLSLYTIYVVVGDVMPLPRCSTMTPIRLDAHGRNAQRSTSPHATRKDFAENKSVESHRSLDPSQTPKAGIIRNCLATGVAGSQFSSDYIIDNKGT